ncbi:hypothetical protein QJS10_CPA02g00247 [Acorus calamus]|uniref:Late embryogenesis abundant protein LEA-2 subgroup domain-containing protein n=1 Tax=Acorus calamus TaxID=4465 RepID=A0AAV9FCG3_ACOCL|nr:hypothetical protein QJS10_CPA02g00247 [Acorus calamus]
MFWKTEDSSSGDAAATSHHWYPPESPSYAVVGQPVDPPDAYVLLLPRRPRRRCRCRCLYSSSSLLSFALPLVVVSAIALLLLWPSRPDLTLVRLNLNHFRVLTRPIVALDIELGLKLKIRNRDFFSLVYESLDVSIGYRGRPLGLVEAEGPARIRARGVSYVDAVLKVNGVRVLDDALYLIEDLARGSIPFDTVTDIKGYLHFFFFEIPIKARMSCEVHVDVEKQTIISQNCYRE